MLEARDRVGGRTWTGTVDGAMLEIGGQWVSPDQTVLLELLDELGLQTYPRYREGESMYIGADGVPVRYTGDPLDIGFNASYLLEILRYMPSDEVKMTFRAPERAATIEPEGWDDPSKYLCLVMPLRLVD